MAYVKTNWQNSVTPVNADNMNQIENELEALDQASGGGSGGASIGGGYTITSTVNSSGAKICILCGKHSYQGNQSGEEDYFGLHEVTMDSSNSYSHTFENAVMFFIVSGNKSYWTYNKSMIVDSTGAHPTELVYNKPYFFVSGGYFDYDA